MVEDEEAQHALRRDTNRRVWLVHGFPVNNMLLSSSPS